MKQKLLYLIPLILAVLCLTPFALYKDSVGFSGKAPVLESLAPSNWKLLDFGVSVSSTLSTTTNTTANEDSANPPLTTGATYKGFPFGAYFKNDSNSTSTDSSSSSDVSAWSWLWTAVDGLLIIITLLLAVKSNRRRVTVPTQPRTDAASTVAIDPLSSPVQAFAPDPRIVNQQPVTAIYAPTTPSQPAPTDSASLPVSPSTDTINLSQANLQQPFQPQTAPPAQPMPITPEPRQDSQFPLNPPSQS